MTSADLFDALTRMNKEQVGKSSAKNHHDEWDASNWLNSVFQRPSGDVFRYVPSAMGDCIYTLLAAGADILDGGRLYTIEEVEACLVQTT